MNKTHSPKRGDIWITNFDPTIGAEIKKKRPALIISNDINNQLASTVTVAAITSYKNEKVYPFEVLISSLEGTGLTKESIIKCSQIRTVDKSRLLKFAGRIQERLWFEIERALKVHLDING